MPRGGPGRRASRPWHADCFPSGQDQATAPRDPAGRPHAPAQREPAHRRAARPRPPLGLVDVADPAAGRGASAANGPCGKERTWPRSPPAGPRSRERAARNAGRRGAGRGVATRGGRRPRRRAPRRGRARRPRPRRHQPGRRREQPARQPEERVGPEPRRQQRHRGLRHPDERQPRPDRAVQGQDERQVLPRRRLPARLLRRRGRPAGRDPRAVRDPEPAGAAAQRGHRARRRRQLGRHGLLGGAGQRGLGRLRRQARAHRRHLRREPRPVRRPRRRAGRRHPAPDLRHHLAGLQHLGRQQPLRRLARRPGLQGQLQPPVRQPLRRHHGHDRAARLPVRLRLPGAPLARGQRLRRLLRRGRGRRPRRRGAARAQALPHRRPRRVLVGAAARQRRGGARRRGQPRLPQRQRGVLEDALGGRHRRLATPPTARWSATRRPTPTPRSTRSTRRPGPARGATRASARPPTAAARRTGSPARSSWSTTAASTG